MNVDCVAETSGCLLKFNFTAASGSPDCSCHHGVLKKKATPRIDALLQWHVASTLPA